MNGLLLSLTMLGLAVAVSTGGDEPSKVDEYGRYLSQWRAKNVTSYKYEMRRICECGLGSNALVRIVVRDGLAWDITYAESSDNVYGHWTKEARKRVREFAIGDSLDRELWQAYPSIHELFGIIAEALSKPAAIIEVDYAEDYGHPSRVLLDPERLMVDDRIEYIVHNLEPLDMDDMP